ncbi:hypothetical protein B0H19DRAFT_1263643 [Mycena capillaripes]|nr:hypothetical protein B0H19DRAFT_1263643 [Mycena capillaripes]
MSRPGFVVVGYPGSSIGCSHDSVKELVKVLVQFSLYLDIEPPSRSLMDFYQEEVEETRWQYKEGSPPWVIDSIFCPGHADLRYVLLLVAALASAAPPVAESDFPVSFVGNIVVPQIPSGDTRIYYQKADNRISELGVTGPFVGGGRVYISNRDPLIPGDEVLVGTPISCVVLGDHWEEVHLFFVSPAHILSEYIWSLSLNAWRGGPSCSDCIRAQGFGVQPGSQVLYATVNNATGSPALLRVAFVSSDPPDTLSEAAFTPALGWQVGQLNS